MDSIIYLAVRYVLFHRVKSLILIACVTFSIFLPMAGKTVLDKVEVELRSRAVETPYVLGAKGSRFDLVLHALYFDVPPPETITYLQYQQTRKAGSGRPIPIYRTHLVQEDVPLVGVGFEYFSYRNLELAQGNWFGRIGHCVIGWKVARQLQLRVGDKLLSKPENDVNLAGATPVRMEIVGIMKPSGTSDDGVVFTDLKTTWLIDGLGHGHQDIEEEKDPNLFLEKKQRSAIVNQGVLPYIEITDENVGAVHFHGDPGEFPLTALILNPPDEKSATLLQGKIESDRGNGLQVIQPKLVIQQLIEKILKVKQLFDFGSVTIILITILFLVLNTLLSIRLRQREMATLHKIGCGRYTVLGLFAWEYVIVILFSLLLALSLTFGCVDYLQQLILQAIR
jgi:putative ABC transport system permease protein